MIRLYFRSGPPSFNWLIRAGQLVVDFIWLSTSEIAEISPYKQNVVRILTLGR